MVPDHSRSYSINDEESIAKNVPKVFNKEKCRYRDQSDGRNLD